MSGPELQAGAKNCLNRSLKGAVFEMSRMLYKPPRTGFSPQKLFLMRRFLRRLRWWGPRPPASLGARSGRILSALKGIKK